MPEKKDEELHPPFFADDSDEPTIVWVRPPRRLRSFTERVHFLSKLHREGARALDDDEDTDREDETKPDTGRFDEETVV